MSIESFFDNYPPGAELAHLVEQKAEQERKSKIHVLFQEFITEGTDGMRSIGREINEDHIEFYRDGKTSAPIPRKKKMALIINHAAVLFGLSGIAIESTLVEQVFDANLFCDLYEESLRGTPLPLTIEPSHGGVEELTPDDWNNMISLANRDKTFSVFFEPEGLEALPATMAGVLRITNLLPVIQQHTLPAYRTRAEFLVAPQSLASRFPHKEDIGQQ